MARKLTRLARVVGLGKRVVIRGELRYGCMPDAGMVIARHQEPFGLIYSVLFPEASRPIKLDDRQILPMPDLTPAPCSYKLLIWSLQRGILKGMPLDDDRSS